MIYVSVTNHRRVELAAVEIQQVRIHPDQTADYTVRIKVDRGEGVEIGYHQRSISNFPRKDFNVLALLRQALSTLTEEELALVMLPVDASILGIEDRI